MVIDLSVVREMNERAESWNRSAQEDELKAQNAANSEYPQIADELRVSARTHRILARNALELAKKISRGSKESS